MKRAMLVLVAGRQGRIMGCLAAVGFLPSCGILFPRPMDFGMHVYDTAQHDARMRRNVSASMGYRARDRSRRQALEAKTRKGRSIPVHSSGSSSGGSSHYTKPGVIHDG